LRANLDLTYNTYVELIYSFCPWGENRITSLVWFKGSLDPKSVSQRNDFSS
jgi:hypothetical protein